MAAADVFMQGPQDSKAASEPLAPDNAIVLRSYVALYSPRMAELLATEASADGPTVGSFDPNAPYSEVTIELIELSTAAIDDALFRVPEGYKVASAEDLLSKLVHPPQSVPPNR